MTDETPLDGAHAAMADADGDDGARRRFYALLAASELFLLLETEAEGAAVTPRSCELDGQGHVLAFDREERLSRFVGAAAPYAALSGRALVGMLAPERLGLLLNPDVAPSAIALPPEAVAWLAETLAQAPREQQARLRAVHPPKGVDERLLGALDARLASAVGMAGRAYLVGVVHDSGAEGHMLAVIDPAPGAEPALARAVAEIVQFSGADAVTLDVAFFRAGDPAVARFARVGLRFDLPQTEAGAQAGTQAPGMDPETPPRLR